MAMATEAKPKVIVWVNIRCAKWHGGKECGALLCKVDSERWDEAMTDAVEHKCDRCGGIYTLAEYR